MKDGKETVRCTSTQHFSVFLLFFFFFLFFYSSQTQRARLDLTQFYEEKGSAQNRPGILAAQKDIVTTKSATRGGEEGRGGWL